MPARFVEFTLRRRRAVALAWLLVTLAGAWAAATLSSHLSQRFDAPDRPAFVANATILRDFGSGGVIAPIVLVGHRGQAGALRRVAAAAPEARAVVGGPGLTGRHGRLAALVFPRPGRQAPDENDGALAAVRRAAFREHVSVTGQQALQAGGSSGGAGLLVETLLGGAGALVVLAVVFGSALAIVPIMLAISSILGTFLVLRGLAAGFDISFVVQFLVGLIGLGVAIDYSLLLVVRWREERDAGADSENAVRRAMATAGRSIVVSGTTVAIGLIALVAVPVPFVRSIGVGGLLIPIVSVLACLTLLPGILAAAGPRLDRRRDRRRERHPQRTGSVWFTWSEWVVAHRVVSAVVGLAILVGTRAVCDQPQSRRARGRLAGLRGAGPHGARVDRAGRWPGLRDAHPRSRSSSRPATPLRPPGGCAPSTGSAPCSPPAVPDGTGDGRALLEALPGGRTRRPRPAGARWTRSVRCTRARCSSAVSTRPTAT